MQTITACGDFAAINRTLRESIDDSFVIENCLGERFVGAGLSGKKIRINGIPGNALGAYLNGAEIEVFGNAQEAVGDTMNAGSIVIHGRVGDAAGYAMRGGKIFIKGSAGYRTGIHMKAYRDKSPVMVIGGRCGSFLGEYLAGGAIVVLGMHDDGKCVVGNFPCTGMHGGKVFIRGSLEGARFPSGVTVRDATDDDLSEIRSDIAEYCRVFGIDETFVWSERFTVITPNSSNPYKQMYVEN